MADKTNCIRNGKPYYRLTRTIGHKLNSAGNEVPVRKTFYGRNKKEANAKADDYIAKHRNGVNDDGLYFGIELQRWIENSFIHDNRLAIRTRENYIDAWRNNLKDAEIASLPLSEINADVIQQFYSELECGVTSIRWLHYLLRKFFKYCEVSGKGRDFTSAITLPNVKTKADEEIDSEIVTWTDEEIRKIMNGFSSADNRFRFRFFILLAYYTGCRLSELRGLQYSDIDIEKKTISIQRQITDHKELSASDNRELKRQLEVTRLKSRTSRRTIPINDMVISELRRHTKWHKTEMMKNGYRTDFLFTTDSGELYDRRNIRRALDRYYDRIGIEPHYYNDRGNRVHKGIHCYRHTFASNLVKAGVPISVTSRLLGHNNLETTHRYYINIDDDQKVFAIEQLGIVVSM